MGWSGGHDFLGGNRTFSIAMINEKSREFGRARQSKQPLSFPREFVRRTVDWHLDAVTSPMVLSAPVNED
jgi:hypothetical protein